MAGQPAEYSAQLDVNPKADLGIQVGNIGEHLCVLNVYASGVIPRYNSVRPELPLSVGDALVSVNGRRLSAQAMRQTLKDIKLSGGVVALGVQPLESHSVTLVLAAESQDHVEDTASSSGDRSRRWPKKRRGGERGGRSIFALVSKLPGWAKAVYQTSKTLLMQPKLLRQTLHALNDLTVAITALLATAERLEAHGGDGLAV